MPEPNVAPQRGCVTLRSCPLKLKGTSHLKGSSGGTEDRSARRYENETIGHIHNVGHASPSTCPHSVSHSLQRRAKTNTNTLEKPRHITLATGLPCSEFPSCANRATQGKGKPMVTEYRSTLQYCPSRTLTSRRRRDVALGLSKVGRSK